MCVFPVPYHLCEQTPEQAELGGYWAGISGQKIKCSLSAQSTDCFLLLLCLHNASVFLI